MRIYVYVDGNRFVCVGQSRMLSLKPETLFVLVKKTNKTTSYKNMQCIISLSFQLNYMGTYFVLFPF